MHYKNFEIEIKPIGELLNIQLRSECTQQSLGDVFFNMNLLKPVARGDTGVRLGKMLYRTIFHEPSQQFKDEDILPGDTLHLRLMVDREVIRRDGDQGLRLIFRTTADALPDKPVELLCCRYSAGNLGDFLALDPKTSIVRAPITSGSFGKIEMPFPLRILVVLCRTKLSPDFHPDDEKGHLEATFKDFDYLAVDYIGTTGDPPATWNTVRNRLEGIGLPPRNGFPDYYSIFHFIGHGKFDQNRKQGVIFLDKGDGEGFLVPGDRLRGTLKNADKVKMVILQSCETAATDPFNAFHGVAQQITESAVPCVIAMQYEITPRDARNFVTYLYERWLHNDRPLEEAVAAARRQLYEDYEDQNIADPLAWAAPVLFLTSEIRIVRGQPVLPSKNKEQVKELRAQIAGMEKSISELEEQLARPLRQELKDGSQITKGFLEKQRDKLEAQLEALLGTYLDFGNVRASHENGGPVSMPVYLPVRDHKPTRVAFDIVFDPMLVEFERVEGRSSNLVSFQKKAAGRVAITIQGGQGEIQRENEEIAVLVFHLNAGAKTTKLTSEFASVFEGNNLISQECSDGWITVS